MAAEAVRLGLGPKLDSMAEKETMPPKMMATKKMVPFTMGTLDTKSIGLTSATIRARAYLRQGPLANCQRAGRAGLGEQCTPLRKEPMAK